MQHVYSQEENDIFTHPRGRGCVKMLNVMLHGVLCFVPLNLICNLITIRKKDNIFTTHPTGRGRVKVLNILCFHGVLCFVPVNSICSVANLRKME